MAAILINDELIAVVELNGEEIILGVKPKNGEMVRRGMPKKEALKVAGLIVAAATGGGINESISKIIDGIMG